MKNIYPFFILVLILVNSTNVIAQKWFPIGATWNYSANSLTGYTGLITLQVVKDTSVNGVSCKLLSQRFFRTVSNFNPRVDTFSERNLYAWERNDSVYLLQGNEFILAYDFNLGIGDTSMQTAFYVDTPFLTVTRVGGHLTSYVASVDSFTINGQTLKYYVDSFYEGASPASFKLIQRIGTTTFLFPDVCGACASDMPGLLCYTDTIIGTYKPKPAFCNPFSSISELTLALYGGGNVCVGTVDTLNLEVSGGAPPYKYQWSATGSSVLSCDTCSRPYITINGNTTIRVIVTDSGGQFNETSTTFSTDTAGTISITSGSATTFCTGDSVILNAGTGYNRYLWSDSSTASSISVNQSGIYHVTVTVGTNCTSTGELTVNVVTPPTAETIGGNPTITPYQSYTYEVAQVSGIIYNWTVQGGVIQSGQGTNSINVLWSGVGPYLVSLTQTKSSVCSATSTLQVLSTGIQNLEANVVEIYSYYANGLNVIKVNSQSLETYNMRLFDISGRLIFEKTNSRNEETALPNDITKGVYIAEVRFAGGLVKNLKVIAK